MTYTVKAGDTLFGISNQFGVSVMELARINNKSIDTDINVLSKIKFGVKNEKERC